LHGLPVSAVIFIFFLGKRGFGFFGAIFSFLQELSPGLDFIPRFTIAWFVRKKEMKNNHEVKGIKFAY
jgi:hypothetical protein